MALAKNLNNRKLNIKIPKFSRRTLIIISIVAALLVLLIGLLLLWPRLFPKTDKGKTELKYETGDRPLPQKLALWVTADGGLFMRDKADAKSTAVILIPNGTELAAEETQGDWYRVTYQGKSGWVKKDYVTTQAPAEDPLKTWKTYQNKTASYSLRYPGEWVVQDYGTNPATASENYLGLGPQLAPALDPTKLPPVVVRNTKKPITEVEAEYAKYSGVVSESSKISAIDGKKFTYNSSSGVQMTAFVVARGEMVYIFEETGGFSEELIKIIGTVIFT